MFNFSYSGRKDSRLTCLSSKNLYFLHQCAQAIRQASSLYCGIIHSLHDIERGLKNAARFHNSRQFKYWKQQYQQQQITLKRYRFWVHSQRQLIQAETWEEFSKNKSITQCQALKLLRENFLLHGDWAHYSSEALYQVAFKIIPHMESYFDFVQHEVETYKTQLNSAMKKDLQKFVSEWQQWRHRTQISLCHAMAARLSYASRQQQLSADDVLHDIHTKLQKLGIKTADLPTAHHGLTAQHINAFQAYIAHGYSKRVLYHVKYAVSWLTPDAYYSLHTQDNTLYIAPRSIVCFIPKSRFLRWWHKLLGRFDLEQYCIDHQSLFAVCRLLQKRLLTELYHQDLSNFIETLGQTINDIATKVEVLHRHKFSKLYKFLNIDRYHKYQVLIKYWHGQLTVLMDKSTNLLNQLIRLLENKNESSEILNCIHQLLIHINRLKQLGIHNPHQQIYLLSQRFEKIYSASHPAISLIDRLFQGLTEGKLPGNGKLNPLYDYLSNLKLTNLNHFKLLQQKHSLARTTLLQLIANIIHEQTIHPISNHSMMQFSRALMFIKLFGNEHDHQQLLKHAQRLFEHYVKAATVSNTVYESLWYQTIEASLLIITQHFSLSSLNKEIEHLRKIRLNSAFEFRDACALQVTNLNLNTLRQQLIVSIKRYESAIWQLLAKQFNAYILSNLNQLLNLPSIDLPSLTMSQRSVLNINVLGKNTHYWLEQLLWLKNQPLAQLDETALQALQQTCERRATVILCCRQVRGQKNTPHPVLPPQGGKGPTSKIFVSR